jgi:hypothetical protein
LLARPAASSARRNPACRSRRFTRGGNHAILGAGLTKLAWHRESADTLVDRLNDQENSVKEIGVASAPRGHVR